MIKDLKTTNPVQELENYIGINIIENTKRYIKFSYKGERIKFFVTSEVYTSRNLNQGKGFDNLLYDLENSI